MSFTINLVNKDTEKQVAGNKPIKIYAMTVKTHSGIRRIGMKSQKTFDKKYAETR